MMSSSILVAFMLAMGGGEIAGDLLDFAPTEAYWQMRDERIIDVGTMTAVLVDEGVTPSDKLMAIRAMGEVGKADGAAEADKQAALKVLTPLVESKEPFVGQYAKRSIAWIKGEDPSPRPMPTSEQLQADLAILPMESVVVGQVRIDNGVGPVNLSEVIPDFGKAGGGFLPPRKEMEAQITQGILQAIGMVGNVRIDAVTLGVSMRGDDLGTAMVVVRGQYDRINVINVIQEQVKGDDEDQTRFYSIGDIEVVSVNERWNRFALMMPSNDKLIVVFGNSGGENNPPLPIDETAALLVDGGNEIAFSEVLTKQIAMVDREKAHVWVAAQIPDVIKKEAKEIFAPFDAGYIQAVRNAEGGMATSWRVEGKDAQAIAEKVVWFNEQVEEGKRKIEQEMKRNPEMQKMFEPMLKIMDTLEIKAQDKAMIGGVQVPSDVANILPMLFIIG